MNIAIIGAATEGMASCRFYMNRGDIVTICDRDNTVSIPYGAQSQLGDNYLENLDRFDLIVRSAGIHPSVILEKNPNVGPKITSQVNEFLAACPTKNVIGITGTKGKGTTSTLVTKMLEASGHTVHLGGNIGVAVFDLISDIQPSDWVVLELSSFQLIDLRHSPHIAVCLMVVPEHLDWHEDFEEYVSAKQQLFMNQSEDDIAIYYGDNEDSESIAHASEGTIIPYMKEPGAIIKDDYVCIDGQQVCATNEIKLLGEHNWQNICAAVTTVWQVEKDLISIQKVATSFAGLPHRIELVRELNGVSYYNDSFATNQGATIAAIKAITRPKVMIIGGYDRGLDLDKLGDAIHKNSATIRKVMLIGASADRTADILKQYNFDNYTHSAAKDMSEIVRDANQLAESGDAVVFSPGFASFDMFKNFEERGNLFRKTVNEL